MRTNAMMAFGAIVLITTSLSAIVASPAPAATPTVITNTYAYTGATQTFTVPPGVSQITLTATGAQGGWGGRDSSGRPLPEGYQGVVTGTISVTPGQVITLGVGQGGADSPLADVCTGGQNSPTDSNDAVGGTNPLGLYDGGNGAAPGPQGCSGYGGSGGAASVVEIGSSTSNPTSVATIVAGGSGGSGGSGQFPPTLGRIGLSTFTGRTDITSTNGQAGISVYAACGEPSPPGSCDGGGGAGGGGGVQGGAQGEVQFGSGTSDEWYGLGGNPGESSTSGLSGLSESYAFYDDSDDTAGCTGSNSSGNITGSACSSSLDKNAPDTDDSGSVVLSYSTGVPGAPTAVIGTAANSSVALNWTAPTVAGLTAVNDYIVQYSSNGGSSWSTDNTQSISTSASITGLTDGTSYIFQVAAVNSVGQGVFSASSGTLTPSGPPGTPTITSVTPMDGAISVAFSAASTVAPILDYQYQLDGTGTWISGGTTSSPLVISGLINGVGHTVQIRAVNTIGAGSASNTMSATPEATPGAPTITSITPGVGSAVVNFSPGYAGGGSITDYQYQLNGGSWNDAATTTSPITIAALSAGTTYVVAVRAVAVANSVNIYGTSSAGSSVSIPNVPGTPTINSIAPANDALTVNFTPGSNGGLAVSDYKYSTNGGSTWISATSAGAPCTPGTAGSENCTISGLTNGTSYSVEVRGVNAVGDGVASVAQSATPMTIAGAPTINGSAAPVTGNALSISFNAPASSGGATITNYQYSTDAGATWVNRTDTSGTTSPMTITVLSSDGVSPLVNGTTYDVELRAVNAAGDGAASAFASGIPATVPGALSISSAIASSGSIQVTFASGSNGGATITQYQYSINGGSAWNNTGSLATSFAITGLSNGTTYPVTVRAVNSVGNGPSSTSHNATPATVPNQPTITSISRSNVTLDVGFSVGANGGSTILSYQYSTDGGSTWTTAASNASPMVITALSTDGTTPITNGQSYPIEIRAVNGIGASAPSTLTNVAPAAAPSAPTITLAPSDQTIGVGFSITNDGGSPINEVDYQLNGGAWANAGTLSSPFSITGLTNGSPYTVAVRADNAIGNGTTSVTSSAIPLSVPYPPTAVIAVSNSATADISWTAPTNNGGGTISGYTASAFTANAGGSAVSTCSTSNLFCSISGLTNGTTYYVSVVTQNSAGSSLASSPRTSVTPIARPAAPTLTGITAGDAYVSVAFTAGSAGGDPITGYQYSLDGGTTWQNASGTSSPIIITGLTDGTSYTATLRAVSAAGSGAASTNTEAATPFTYPSIVDATHIIANAENLSVVVSWLAPNNNGAVITSYTATAFSALTGGSQITTCSTSSLTCTLSGLSNNTTYYISVQAQNAAGYSDRSTPRIPATPALLPTAPTALIATPADGQISLSWTPGSTGASPISNYQIFESTGGSYSLVTTPTSTALNATITGLTDGIAYTFKVDAINGAGAGPLSAPSSPATPLAAGIVPIATSPVPTPNGFTFSLSNYSALTTYTWTSTNGSTVAESGAGFTVTGLTTNGTSAVTVTASLYGSTTRSVIVNGAAYASGIQPTFSMTTPTTTGFTFSIANFSSSSTYAFTTTNGASATLSSSDVTVTGLALGASSTVTVAAAQPAHTMASASLTGTSLLAGITPTFSSPSSSADGFSFAITNFSTAGIYALSATNGATVSQRNGIVTVTDLSASASSVVTVTVNASGYSTASATRNGSALSAGVVPILSAATSTANGFTFSIVNFATSNTYDVTASGNATLEINGATVTVTGVSSDVPTTVTVTATSIGDDPASATISGEALAPASSTSTTTNSTGTTSTIKKASGNSSATGSTSTTSSSTTSSTSSTTTTTTLPISKHTTTPNQPPSGSSTTDPSVQSGSTQNSPIENALGTGTVSSGSGQQVRVAILANSRSVSVGDANFAMSIRVGTDGVRYISGIVTVAQHAITYVSGRGFAPGSTVTMWVYSAGAKMGTTTVTKTGTFAVSRPLPTSIGIGRHTIVARGINRHHVAISVALGIRVIASSSAVKPAAGSSNAALYVGGGIVLVLLITGGFFFLARRRRDEEDEIQVVT